MPIDEKETQDRKSHLGRHLHELTAHFKKSTLSYIKEHGFPELTEGQLNLLIHLNATKPTPTDQLIRDLGVSKQAISRMLLGCEKKRWIKRVPSPVDARNRDIMLDKTGMKLLKVGLESVAFVEDEIAAAIGKRAFSQLKKGLAEANKVLGLVTIDS